MKFKEELHEIINDWDLATVDKMILYEDIFYIYKHTVKEEILRVRDECEGGEAKQLCDTLLHTLDTE